MATGAVARVLVVEDGETKRVAQLLSNERFVVVTALAGREALGTLPSFRPDVVVIELAKVTAAAVELCAAMRAATMAPLVVACTHAKESEVIAVFGAGADAFALQSGPHELVARVRALLRRAPSQSEPPLDVLTVGPIMLDRASRELHVGGRRVAMPRREFDIAEMLMRKAGRVVSRDEIVRQLWGTARDTKSLDVQVGRLRAKLALAEGWQRIITVRGVGFRLALDEERPGTADDGIVIDLTRDGVHIDLVGIDLLEESTPA